MILWGKRLKRNTSTERGLDWHQSDVSALCAGIIDLYETRCPKSLRLHLPAPSAILGFIVNDKKKEYGSPVRIVFVISSRGSPESGKTHPKWRKRSTLKENLSGRIQAIVGGDPGEW